MILNRLLPVMGLLAGLLAGCVAPPATHPGAAGEKAPGTPAAAAVTPPPAPVAAPLSPAEVALNAGLKAYQDGQYPQAEQHLKNALQAGLPAAGGPANVHKHLAFIYCTSKRVSMCRAEFKAARAADPRFELTKAEAGHPMWGPVYRKALPPLKP